MTWEFEKVAGPFEGPGGGVAWDGQALLFSIIELGTVNPAGRILRYDPRSGEVGEFRRYTNRTNGIAFSADGKLYGCQSQSRRVIQFDPDGSASLLTDRIDGRLHNQPQDLAVDRQGRIWFTDPHSALPQSGPIWQGQTEPPSVLRLERRYDHAWQIKRMTYDTRAPSGIAISADQQTLYVGENDGGPDGKREVRTYLIEEDGGLGPYRVLHIFGADHRGPHGGPQGMCPDGDGNLVVCAGRPERGPGPLIYVLSPAGRPLESHPFPAGQPMNCTFGDPDLSSLYVTSDEGSLYRARSTGRRGWLLYPNS